MGFADLFNIVLGLSSLKWAFTWRCDGIVHTIEGFDLRTTVLTHNPQTLTLNIALIPDPNPNPNLSTLIPNP